jgi:hypothetical protein
MSARKRNNSAQKSATKKDEQRALPAQAAALPALAGIDAMNAYLRLWRGYADCARLMMRTQQDFMLSFCRAPLARENGDEAAWSRGLCAPIVQASIAMEQTGEELVRTQRRALQGEFENSARPS